MEAVCQGKQWDVAIAYRNGHIIGALPYLIGQRAGMRFILQPQLTQYSGPYYRYPDGLSEHRRLSFERSVAKELWQQIKSLRLAYYQQSFSPSITNWLPFYWEGCQQTTRYSYRLDDISDPQRLFQAFDRNERQKKILHFQQLSHPVFDLQPAHFARFHQAYWQSKGEKDLLSETLIIHICTTAIQRGQGMLIGLADNDDHLVAARFVVYDDRCAYSLLSALDPKHYHNGATETLIWNTLLALGGKTRAYDFEGSMDEGIEYFYRSFGAVQTPYFQVSRTFSPLFRILLFVKQRLS